MSANKEVIIIGGGVIGLACANYLIDKGARVRIIERDKVGQGASHGNCGLLCFSDVIPLCSPGAVSNELVKALKRQSALSIKPSFDMGLWAWLFKFASKCNRNHMKAGARSKYEIVKYSVQLFDTLFAGEPMPCDFEKKGLLIVFKNKENFENYGETNRFLEAYNMGAKRIDRDQLQELEPALSDGMAGCLPDPPLRALRTENGGYSLEKRLPHGRDHGIFRVQ